MNKNWTTEEVKILKEFHTTKSLDELSILLNRSQGSLTYKLGQINGDVKAYSKEFTMWNTARYKSKKEKLNFNITVEDIIIPERCQILDIPLIIDWTGIPNDNTPSLDRIVPERGYVKGNIQVISLRANRMKQNLTEEIIEKLLKYMKENIK